MELIKRCPTCGAENKPSEMMCARCFGDISGIAPTSPAETSAPPSTPEPGKLNSSLALRCPSGESILVSDGDVIGRSAVGKELLLQYSKVSRQHLQFQRTTDGWLIKDLGSANGTYVDGIRVQASESVTIAPGQRLGLSSSLILLVAGA